MRNKKTINKIYINNKCVFFIVHKCQNQLVQFFCQKKLAEKLRTVGEQIRLARLRRNISLELVAERAQCSRITAAKVEKGDPTVSMGTYLRILFALQLADDIEMIAKNDPIGRDLQDLKERKRASR